ncbi:hypothetical protein THAOC_34556, partial [Thalassiosira oceanica]
EELPERAGGVPPPAAEARGEAGPAGGPAALHPHHDSSFPSTAPWHPLSAPGYSSAVPSPPIRPPSNTVLDRFE